MSNPFIPLEKPNIIWRNGLPFSERFNDIYFSRANGLKEAQHVYIEGNNLLQRWQEGEEDFVIAETGFGFGLNFLLTISLWLNHAPSKRTLRYLSCEKFPFDREELQKCLSLWPELQQEAEQLLEQYPPTTPGFHHMEFANGRIQLTLMLGDALTCYKELLHCGDCNLERKLSSTTVDAWFLDGFTPSKNPDLWTPELFHIFGLLSKTGTTLATYSAAKKVRDDLESAGFVVKKTKGFGRKCDMSTAHFASQEIPIKALRKTPWHRPLPQSAQKKKAIVLGSGLAGCFVAQGLAKRGWEVTLLDERKEVGLGASGNRQAILYPKLSAFQSPLTAFMLSSFLYAKREYKKWLEPLPGLIQLAHNKKEKSTQEQLQPWLLAHPELGVLLDAKQASALSGIDLEVGGIFIPGAGCIDSKALCQRLSQASNINRVHSTAVETLVYDNEGWRVGDHLAEVLVIANGHRAAEFSQTAYLPLKSIAGQMTWISSHEKSARLKLPLCGEGHILPAQDHSHAIGASYRLNSKESIVSQEDDVSNLEKLLQLPAKMDWPAEIVSNWAGVRAATTDYLPLVGPVPDVSAFKQCFSRLASNAKRWIPEPGPYLPGLYVCAGFGSRGLTTIPLSSEVLVSIINNEFNTLPTSLIKSLSPARFLIKEITKTNK